MRAYLSPVWFQEDLYGYLAMPGLLNQFSLLSYQLLLRIQLTAIELIIIIKIPKIVVHDMFTDTLSLSPSLMCISILSVVFLCFCNHARLTYWILKAC